MIIDGGTKLKLNWNCKFLIVSIKTIATKVSSNYSMGVNGFLDSILNQSFSLNQKSRFCPSQNWTKPNDLNNFGLFDLEQNYEYLELNH